jgi:hypothetical protein
LLASGDLVIVPIGFRCYTKAKIEEHLGVKFKKSYPFDSGFFPPLSVANVLMNKKVDLTNGQYKPSHVVCIKHENHEDSTFGLGIKFIKSTYAQINSTVKSREMPGINKYLDSTFGYYTLDIKNQFILAHYNWHVFAYKDRPDRGYDPIANISNINNTLNRRLDRMLRECNNAKYILFIFEETQGYHFMMIDECFHDLHDLNSVEKATKEVFAGSICIVKKLSDVNSPKKILSLLV